MRGRGGSNYGARLYFFEFSCFTSKFLVLIHVVIQAHIRLHELSGVIVAYVFHNTVNGVFSVRSELLEVQILDERYTFATNHKKC